jgi:hypothetical protein
LSGAQVVQWRTVYFYTYTVAFYRHALPTLSESLLPLSLAVVSFGEQAIVSECPALPPVRSPRFSQQEKTMEHADPQYVSMGILLVLFAIAALFAISNTPGM